MLGLSRSNGYYMVTMNRRETYLVRMSANQRPDRCSFQIVEQKLAAT